MNTSPQRENESTREYVTRLMEEAVALKGEDYVYEMPRNKEGDVIGCSYIHNDQPSCIVGHVLVAAGVDPDQLHQHEGVAAENLTIRVQLWDTDYTMSRALNAAQEAQDSGETWGEALRVFKEELEKG